MDHRLKSDIEPGPDRGLLTLQVGRGEPVKIIFSRLPVHIRSFDIGEGNAGKSERIIQEFVPSGQPEFRFSPGKVLHHGNRIDIREGPVFVIIEMYSPVEGRTYRKAAQGFAGNFHPQVLRIGPQVMPQIVHIGLKGRGGDIVLVHGRQSVGVFRREKHILHRPVAQPEAPFPRQKIEPAGIGHPFDGKLIHEQTEVQVQVFDVARTDIDE